MQGNPVLFTVVLLILLAVYVYFEKKRRDTEDRYMDSFASGPNPFLDMDEVFAASAAGLETVEAVEAYSRADLEGIRLALRDAGIKNHSGSGPGDSQTSPENPAAFRIQIFRNQYDEAAAVVAAFAAKGRPAPAAGSSPFGLFHGHIRSPGPGKALPLPRMLPLA